MLFSLFVGISAYAQSLSSEESTLKEFEFRDGKLVFTYLYVPSKYSSDEAVTLKPSCFAKTYFLDKKKGFVEDIDGEFSGAVKLSKSEEDGEWDGDVALTIQPVTMRYELLCGWINKMLEVNPGDWGSDNQIKEFKSLQAKEAKKEKTAKKSAVKIAKGADMTISLKSTNGKKSETMAVYSLDVPGGAAFSPRPGDQKAVVGLFDVIVYEPIRLKTMTLKVHDKKNLPFSRLYLNVDGKPADSFDSDYDSKKNEFFFRGLGDHALANKLLKGKHRIAILADIKNPGKKNILTDNFTIMKIQALTGKSMKADMAKSLNLKSYTVKHRATLPSSEGSAYESYADVKK